MAWRGDGCRQDFLLAQGIICRLAQYVNSRRAGHRVLKPLLASQQPIRVWCAGTKTARTSSQTASPL